MTATQWSFTRASAMAAIADFDSDFPWDDEQRAYMDAAAWEVLDRESAVQAAIDLAVKRTLGLGVEPLCPIEHCGRPMVVNGYARNPHGYPAIGFVAHCRCLVHSRSGYWMPLFEEQG